MNNPILYKELNANEIADIYGGDWLANFGYNCKVAYNKTCIAIVDFFTPTDIAMSETLMNCI